jgi:DNA-binding PadR family transcriptional regulator
LSATRLLILGVLRSKQPAHGYEVRRELESWGAERWANIAYGSIYHALGRMADQGLVKLVEASEPSGGPARNTYALTKLGEAEFQQLLRRYWSAREPTIDPLQVAVSFMGELPHAELVQILRQRSDAARAEAQALVVENERLPEGTPPSVAENHLLAAFHAEAEARWAEQALRKALAREAS